MLGQGGDVRRALAQAGQVDMVGAQAVEKVAPEALRVEQLFQRPVGGHDHPGVGCPALVRAHGEVFALVEQAQELELGDEA